MQEPIEEYPLVHAEFNYELKSSFLTLVDRLEEVNANPERQMNEILAQELRRIKSHTHNYRNYQRRTIEALGVKRRIHSLRKEVKSLRCKESTPKRRKRASSLQPPLQYSVLKKQLEVKNQVYTQQKRRSEMQQKHILSIQNAISELDQKLEVYSESDCSVSQKSPRIGVSKRLKLLQSKKKQLLKSKQDINIGYDRVLRQRMSKLMTIKQTGMERQELEERVDRNLNSQKRILKEMGEESGVSEPVPSSQYEHLREANKLYRRLRLKTQTQMEAETPKNIYNSIGNILVKRDVPTRGTRTISTQHTPSRERYTTNIIMEKRRSFRTPINLSPCTYKINELASGKSLSAQWGYESQSQRIRHTGYAKQGLVNTDTASQIKLKETSNFDVSMTASMYNRSRGIEFINQSIVDLATIKEEGGNRQSSTTGVNANSNETRQRLISVKKGGFSKGSASQTTKQQVPQYLREQISKGVPYEVDQPSEHINPNFQLGYALPRHIRKRSIKFPTLNIQQY